MTTPTEYKVSTITCNARLGSANLRVNLQQFFEQVSISPNSFMWVDYVGQHRGEYPKKRKSIVTSPTDEKKKKKSFDNQVTVIYKMPGYFPNIKIFGNAAVHMTGVRTPEDGQKIVDALAAEMQRLGDAVITPVAEVRACDFVIRMINSGFSVPFKVRRKNLHQLLIGSKYNNICSFQPLTYPGVKLEYYWNSDYNNDGICRCTGNCFGKGSGHGDGHCKKVTVAAFESGQLLITGANAFCQIDSAYAFITGVIRDNIQEITKTIPSAMPA
jgi:TATA-box binding protein (TBP) (component of TFIID and TFIIIB)